MRLPSPFTLQAWVLNSFFCGLLSASFLSILLVVLRDRDLPVLNQLLGGLLLLVLPLSVAMIVVIPLIWRPSKSVLHRFMLALAIALAGYPVFMVLFFLESQPFFQAITG